MTAPPRPDAPGSDNAEPAIDLADLTFAWRRGLKVLDIPAFRLARGERLFLRGPSGSGKSTLLSLIAGVTAPQSGRVGVLGADMAKLSPARRDALRGERIGVIFQMFNLAPYLTVLENVLLPSQFSSARRARIRTMGRSPREEAMRLIERLGLPAQQLGRRRASDLSVGQQQRVAAARALLGAPDLILADEPTSALDTEARQAFISLLLEECRERGSTLLFVSHDMALAGSFDRTVDLRDINRAHLPAPGAA
jgi:putative ABC transport system ATP-binding protein